MDFKYSALKYTEDDLRDVELFSWRAEADFAVEAAGTTVFAEPDFLVVELAVGLRRWLEHGFPARRPYDHVSVEFSEAGVIYLRPADDGRSWLVGSVLDETEPVAVSPQDVADAVTRFYAGIEADVATAGFDLTRAFALPTPS